MTRAADLKQGRAVRKKVNGKRYGKLTTALAETMPDFEDFIDEVLFGKIWARPGLDLKQRAIATIAALVALQRLPQLKAYVGNALNVGVSRDEILEIMMHLALYAGVPAAANGVLVAREVFAEEGPAQRGRRKR